jgi:hypothetical protein
LNWAELLGLPIHAQPDLKLASKHPVEYMWKEEDSAFPSMPDAPTKWLKLHPTATDGNKISQKTIEHHCGLKQIQMTIAETAAGTLLKNLMADKLSLDSSESKIATVLTQAKMKRIQSLMDPNNKEQSPRFTNGPGRRYWGHISMPVAENPHIDATNLEEERMVKNTKMFVDRGTGCFTTEELLSICLLSLMQDIGAPLKTYGKIISLFKDAITDRVALTTTIRHRQHTAIKHFLQRAWNERPLSHHCHTARSHQQPILPCPCTQPTCYD